MHYRDEDDLAPDDKYYIRGKRNALWFWQHFGRTITLAVFDLPIVSAESQVLYSFIIKVRMDTPNFYFLILIFDSIIHYFNIHNLAEKIFCSILISKFLKRDYFLFFMPSSSIADFGTVWLDTYIKIIVICREIDRTLRKVKQLIIIFFYFVHLSTSKHSFPLNFHYLFAQWKYELGKDNKKVRVGL